MNSPLQILRNINAYRRIMPITDAVRLSITDEGTGNIRIKLTPSGLNLTMRRGTSDLKCFRKIFVEEEYDAPFPMTPKFIVDAGANIGIASQYFTAKYPGCRIVAIEPESSNFEILQKNCGSLPNVTLLKAALWPEQKALAIQSATAEKWSFSVGQSTGESHGHAQVNAVTLPEIMQQFGVERINLLKIDIESAELELFSQGADEWLDRVDVLVIELHDRMRPGCARAFYSKIVTRNFRHEIFGENIFIQFSQPSL